MSEVAYRVILRLERDLLDAASALLFETGIGGLEERDGEAGPELVLYAGSEAEALVLHAVAESIAERLSSAGQDWAVKREPIDDGWRTAFREFLEPVKLTDTWWAAPPGHQVEDPAHTLWIGADPCFGMGSHATTRLAARLVGESVAELGPDARVLDVGSGTGVLGLLALKHGARSVVGLDIDPLAVAAAQRNAALNGLEAACRFSNTDVAALTEEFECVVANLEAPTLLELASSVARRVAPTGKLIVTGFLVERCGEMEALFRALGYLPAQRLEQDDWAALTLGAAVRPLGNAEQNC